jgi:membrane-bound lytic murein transglycosylase D
MVVQTPPALGALPASRAVFVVPPELRPQVEFWKRVFATYSRRQVAIHDTEHLDRVYAVLDFRSGEFDGEDALIEARVDDEEERVRALLLRLHASNGSLDGLTPDEQRIARLFANDPSERRFLEAAAPDRIRSQSGLRERFAAGIEIGHRYFPEMEAIFAAERVPVELTRLPLIESCFNVRAYSKVGAAGVWQFMPSTGRRFLRVDSLIDERRDPITSSRAAARFLRENYDRLGAWPLALTAYNHGPAGVARAVREVGSTDIVRIIQEYNGPAFKFASRNFYPEFLAALDVERNHEKHFGELALLQPIATHDVTLSHPIELRTAAAYAGVDRDVLADMNPSFCSMIGDGRRAIPAGSRLRIPARAREQFGMHYQEYVSIYERTPRTKTARGSGKGKTRVASRAKAPRRQAVAKAPARSAKQQATTKKRTTRSGRACKGRCGTDLGLATHDVGA